MKVQNVTENVANLPGNTHTPWPVHKNHNNNKTSYYIIYSTDTKFMGPLHDSIPFLKNN